MRARAAAAYFTKCLFLAPASFWEQGDCIWSVGETREGLLIVAKEGRKRGESELAQRTCLWRTCGDSLGFGEPLGEESLLSQSLLVDLLAGRGGVLTGNDRVG